MLAIYELANCYRQGWGVPKDLEAAFQYYLTAANLGDTDAMNEVALCYLEGYGTKKNKVSVSPNPRDFSFRSRMDEQAAITKRKGVNV